jgi:hypothetical protein
VRAEADEQIAAVNDLIGLFGAQKNTEIVAKMKEIVPEFISNNSEYESLDKK